MPSSLLAALAGGLSGLGQGLQYNQQQQAQDEEAKARRRSEALREVLSTLQARDQLGLVPKAQATGRMSAMLRSLSDPDGQSSAGALGSLGRALAPVIGQIDRRPTVSLPNATGGADDYVVDPTQSASARQARAAQEENDRRYGRERADAQTDAQQAAAAKAAQADADNKREYETYRTAFPKSATAAQYNPSVDYGALMQRDDALDRQNRGFGQARALEGMRQSGDLAQARARSGGSGDGAARFGHVMQFRTAYENNPTVKAANEIAQAVQVAKRAGAGDSGISDVSLVYAAAKAFDPTSVVREGEFATIERSQSIPQQLRGRLIRARDGERLTPEMRQQIVKAIQDRGTAARASLQPVRQRFTQLAGQYGLPLEETVYDPFDAIDAATDTPANAPSAARVVPTIGAPNVNKDRPPLTNFMLKPR